MSASRELANSNGGGDTAAIDDWEPYPESDDTTPSRVYVNDTRIPSGDIDLHVRKEGPLDVTRYAEGYFPSVWNDTAWIDTFDTHEEDTQSSPDTVRVDVRDHTTGDFYPAFYGTVTGVGNAADGGPQWWNWRAEGPGLLLDKIPASTSFHEASANDVLSYITDRLDEKLLVPVTYETPQIAVQEDRDSQSDDEYTRGDTYAERYNPNDPNTPDGNRSIADDLTSLSSYKTFQYGKHMLSDVVEWFAQKTNLYIWLTPTTSGVVLTAAQSPPLVQHTAHYLGGDTQIENNDALSELKPVNTLIVKAPAKKSVQDTDTYTYNERGTELVAVKARHQTLYERAGGVELHSEPHRLSDAMTKTEVVNEARKRLKTAIDDTTAGDMQTLLRSPITPYDTIEAKPTVDEYAATDMDSLTYEVSRVHQQVRASGLSETSVNVGIHTDSLNDIEIIDSWQPEGA